MPPSCQGSPCHWSGADGSGAPGHRVGYCVTPCPTHMDRSSGQRLSRAWGQPRLLCRGPKVGSGLPSGEPGTNMLLELGKCHVVWHSISPCMVDWTRVLQGVPPCRKVVPMSWPTCRIPPPAPHGQERPWQGPERTRHLASRAERGQRHTNTPRTELHGHTYHRHTDSMDTHGRDTCITRCGRTHRNTLYECITAHITHTDIHSKRYTHMYYLCVPPTDSESHTPSHTHARSTHSHCPSHFCHNTHAHPHTCSHTSCTDTRSHVHTTHTHAFMRTHALTPSHTHPPAAMSTQPPCGHIGQAAFWLPPWPQVRPCPVSADLTFGTVTPCSSMPSTQLFTALAMHQACRM